MQIPFVSRLICAAALTASASIVHAIGIDDGIGDYVAGFTGSKAGDLDVVNSFVTYNVATDKFVFSGTMNADIQPGDLYVWGVNRGAGTAGFAAQGFGGVLFDAIVRFSADGSGAANGTPFAAGTAKVIGSTIIAEVDGSLLGPTGFAKTAYTFNLWPRDTHLAGFAAISDFAPDNANALVTVIGSVPEPETYAMLGVGLGVLALARRRARQAD